MGASSYLHSDPMGRDEDSDAEEKMIKTINKEEVSKKSNKKSDERAKSNQMVQVKSRFSCTCKKSRILVVEDNYYNLNAIKIMIKQTCKVGPYTAQNG